MLYEAEAEAEVSISVILAIFLQYCFVLLLFLSYLLLHLYIAFIATMPGRKIPVRINMCNSNVGDLCATAKQYAKKKGFF